MSSERHGRLDGLQRRLVLAVMSAVPALGATCCLFPKHWPRTCGTARDGGGLALAVTPYGGCIVAGAPAIVSKDCG
jgi:hypothetical protein